MRARQAGHTFKVVPASRPGVRGHGQMPTVPFMTGLGLLMRPGTRQNAEEEGADINTVFWYIIFCGGIAAVIYGLANQKSRPCMMVGLQVVKR